MVRIGAVSNAADVEVDAAVVDGGRHDGAGDAKDAAAGASG